MPYDQFTIGANWQGDLLQTLLQIKLSRLASIGNTLNNDEGGTDEEGNFRVALSLIDRVKPLLLRYGKGHHNRHWFNAIAIPIGSLLKTGEILQFTWRFLTIPGPRDLSEDEAN